MLAPEFYSLVLALWGEDWRPRLKALLAEHGHHYTRQTFWNWKAGKTPVPGPVAVLVTTEARKQGIVLQNRQHADGVAP